MALLAYEGQQCPSCGNYQVLVELPNDKRNVAWAEHDGRKIAVTQYRCLACASADAVKRAWHERHKNDEPVPGQVAAGDGRLFMARPAIEEE